MSNSLEKNFAQKHEKLESAKKIKEERALKLAREIKRIKEKISKEAGTIKDYQRIIELAKKIESLYNKAWELEGKLTKKNILVEHRVFGAIYEANFSPEGDKIVIGSNGRIMQVLSLTEGKIYERGILRPKVLAEFKTEGVVYTANFNPEGDKIVIGDSRGIMRVLSLTEGEIDEKGILRPKILVEFNVEGAVYEANFSPEGDKIVIGSSDKMMRVLSLTEGKIDERGILRPKVLAEFKTEGVVYTANFNPEGDKIVIGGNDKMMKVLSLIEDEIYRGKILIPRVLVEFEANGVIYEANFSPEGDKIVIVTNKGIMKVLSLTEGEIDERGILRPKVLAEFKTRLEIYTANFNPEGDKIVIGDFDKMKVLSLTEGEIDERGILRPKVLAEFETEGWVYTANFSPEGDKIVIGDFYGVTKVIGEK
ncbi:MAG: hypothetical protein KatS3mg096_025 [Candidatus Parcubacteria bacterium]|nr:MAG: hypothetical protein KatS3mg096_025 [Candidatus Parcubacteria bacterium]